jgi:hypothetical protein
MKLVRKSGTTASQANRGKSVNNSIAEAWGNTGYGSFTKPQPYTSTGGMILWEWTIGPNRRPVKVAAPSAETQVTPG